MTGSNRGGTAGGDAPASGQIEKFRCCCLSSVLYNLCSGFKPVLILFCRPFDCDTVRTVLCVVLCCATNHFHPGSADGKVLFRHGLCLSLGDHPSSFSHDFPLYLSTMSSYRGVIVHFSTVRSTAVCTLSPALYRYINGIHTTYLSRQAEARTPQRSIAEGYMTRVVSGFIYDGRHTEGNIQPSHYSDGDCGGMHPPPFSA